MSVLWWTAQSLGNTPAYLPSAGDVMDDTCIEEGDSFDDANERLYDLYMIATAACFY